MGSRPIGTVLADLAAERPGAPALTVGPVTLTRAELDARTDALAWDLADRGVSAGSIVAVVLPNGVGLVETAIAAWKLGATPMVLPAGMPAAERAELLELAAPSLVVSDDSLVGAAASAGAGQCRPLTPRASRWWRASVSGGSTGRPKVILSTRPGLADPDERTLYLRRDGCTVVPGPLYHGAPFLFASYSLFRGKHLVLLAHFDAEETLRAVDDHRADYLLLVPTMMSRISKLPEETRAAADLSGLQTVLHLGAACPVWLKQAWIDWLGPSRVHELYAGTEGQAMTWITGEQWLAHRGSVGRAIGGATMQAFGPDFDPLPPGQVGEIFMLPPEDAAATYTYVGAEARRRGRWESLGDMGWLDEDGYVYIADRRTDMIVSGGANVYPAEVESAIEEHPDVVTAAVIGLADDDLGHRVHAIVQTTGPLTGTDLVGFLRDRIVRYKIPRTFEFVTEPIRDEAGKVRRAALRAERGS